MKSVEITRALGKLSITFKNVSIVKNIEKKHVFHTKWLKYEVMLTISSSHKWELVHRSILDQPSGPHRQLVVLATGKRVVLPGRRVHATSERHRTRNRTGRILSEHRRAVKRLLQSQHRDSDQDSVHVELESAELRVRKIRIRLDPPDSDVGPARQVDLSRHANLPNARAGAHECAEVNSLYGNSFYYPQTDFVSNNLKTKLTFGFLCFCFALTIPFL